MSSLKHDFLFLLMLATLFWGRNATSPYVLLSRHLAVAQEHIATNGLCLLPRTTCENPSVAEVSNREHRLSTIKLLYVD